VEAVKEAKDGAKTGPKVGKKAVAKEIPPKADSLSAREEALLQKEKELEAREAALALAAKEADIARREKEVEEREASLNAASAASAGPKVAAAKAAVKVEKTGGPLKKV
jgi:hypothetical protein